MGLIGNWEWELNGFLEKGGGGGENQKRKGEMETITRQS